MVWLQAVLPLRLCWHGHGIHPVSPLEWFRPWDEAELCRVIEIKFQTAAILRIQRKVDVVAQVGFERALRQFQILRRLVADFAEVRKPEIARSKKISGEFGRGQLAPHGPDRENCRQSGQTSPFTHYVIDIEQLRSCDSERGGVANRLPFRAGPTVLFDAKRNAQRRITD